MQQILVEPPLRATPAKTLITSLQRPVNQQLRNGVFTRKGLWFLFYLYMLIVVRIYMPYSAFFQDTALPPHSGYLSTKATPRLPKMTCPSP